MENVLFLMYGLLGCIALFFAGYNVMYKKEIHRMEKQVGITIPFFLLQLITAIITGSLMITSASLVLLFFTFF